MVLESFRLDGRTALVTGCARGLGRGIALALAEAGADIACLDRAPARETESRVREIGRRFHTTNRNLEDLDPIGASEVVAESVSALGRLDILVNNAGIIRRSPTLALDGEDWRAVMQVNLDSAFYLSQAAARRFMEQGAGGKIINVVSMLSFQGGFQAASYAASKSALAGLTRALANEWAKAGINVNALAPGYFETEVTAEIRADSRRSEAILARIPAGRWGNPKDLSGAAVFLASDASSYVHGTVLQVDGGWLSW